MSKEFLRYPEYTFLDFKREAKRQSPFESKKAALEWARDKSKYVLARIMHGDGYWFKKNARTPESDGLFDVTRRLPELGITYRESRELSGGSTTTKVVSLKSNVLYEDADIIPQFLSVTFKPSGKCDRDEFNLWVGYKGNRVELTKSDQKIAEAFVGHVRDVWCDGDPTLTRYLLSWLSHTVRKPGVKTGVALFLTGKQGAGKNVLTNFLRDWVYGSAYTHETVGVQSITGRFNQVIKGKTIMVVNELSTVKEEFHGSFDKMKSLITDEWVVVEPKGLEMYKVPNLVNFIMFSNHSASVRVESGDRRYVCISMSDHRVGDTQYFEDLVSTLYNEHAGNVVFTYLTDYKGVPLYPLPKTTLHDEMLTNGMDSACRFVYDITPDAEGNTEWELKVSHPDRENLFDGKSIEVKHLYQCYQQWCTENCEAILTRNRFIRSVKGLGLESKRATDKVSLRRQTRYVLSPEVFLTGVTH